LTALFLWGVYSLYGQNNHYVAENFYINSGSFAYIATGDTVHIEGNITTARHVATAQRGMLSFAGTADWLSSNSSFVNGYVRSHKTSAFVFPVGQGVYRPAAISNSADATPTDAAYYNTAQYPTTALADGLLAITNESWIIQGTVAATITLSWTTDISAFADNLDDLCVAGWNTTLNNWVEIPSEVELISSIFGVASDLETKGTISTTSPIVPNSYAAYTIGKRCAHTVTVLAEPATAGTASVISGSNTVNCGEIIEVEATETNADYRFLQWKSDDGTFLSIANPYSFTVTGETTVVAVFEYGDHVIRVSANPVAGGTVSGGGIYEENETVELEAIPNVCYEFINWTDDDDSGFFSTENPLIFNAIEDRKLTANFEAQFIPTPTFDFALTLEYLLNATPVTLPENSTNGINGVWEPPVIVTSIPGTETYTFTPATCAHTVQVTVTVILPPFVITATSGANGTIDPKGATEVEPGDDQTFTFTSAADYEIDKVYVDGVDITASIVGNSYTFENVDDNHTIMVLFKSTTPSLCTEQVYDVTNNIIYNVVELEGLCWTKENLRGTLYAHGGAIPFAKPYIYMGVSMDPEIFGLLYTWYSATGVLEDYTAEITCNMQGICPMGWRLPTQGEWNSLRAYPAQQLMSTQYWLDPQGGGTDDFGFSAIPAGWYNGTLNRYQDLYGFAGWWASNTPAGANAYYFYLTYYCDELRSDLTNKMNAMSVRCVME
ncbi:MAG: hypothetical protein FWD09_01940, partial [Lentimicrobiaceae bacterium]|nr:hypothetical protein [Lentimicrobiaceae bacterium]